jgi:hypothetical protein
MIQAVPNFAAAVSALGELGMKEFSALKPESLYKSANEKVRPRS